MFFKKIICKIFGCKWKYNFKSLPNKAICNRCNSKSILNLHTLEWEKTLSFGTHLGTDEEIKKRWQ